MTRDALSQTATKLPKLPWLKLTCAILYVAYSLFALGRRLPHAPAMQWLASRVVSVAACALDHAPADSYLEFRADLPVQI